MIGIYLGLTLSPGGVWSPLSLGTALYDMWDSENVSLFTLSGSTVTTWTSTKMGYAATQTISASKPVLSSTAFGGRPGVVFDGADDFLTAGTTGIFPTGAAESELWALVDQTAPASDVASRVPASYGGGGNDARFIQRRVVSGNNVVEARVGLGATTVATTTVATFFGRSVVRARFGATTTSISLNGGAEGSVSATPATSALRTRIGATAFSTASNFFQGVVSLIAVTAPLTADQATQMLKYLKARGGIS